MALACSLSLSLFGEKRASRAARAATRLMHVSTALTLRATLSLRRVQPAHRRAARSPSSRATLPRTMGCGGSPPPFPRRHGRSSPPIIADPAAAAPCRRALVAQGEPQSLVRRHRRVDGHVASHCAARHAKRQRRMARVFSDSHSSHSSHSSTHTGPASPPPRAHISCFDPHDPFVTEESVGQVAAPPRSRHRHRIHRARRAAEPAASARSNMPRVAVSIPRAVPLCCLVLRPRRTYTNAFTQRW